MKNQIANKKLLLICFFIFFMILGAIFLFSALQNNSFEDEIAYSSNRDFRTQVNPKSSSIPITYSQDLDLDGEYVYNVTDFGGPAGWYNFTSWPGDSYEGDWEPKVGGQIKINFTGFFDKDPNNWGDEFDDPIPWMDIEIIKNDAGVLVSNFTLTNRSNTELSNNLILGYSSFQPGFLIPIDNLTNVKKLAIDHASTGYFPGQSIVEESYNFLYVEHENIGGLKTSLIYDRWTGLLVWANASLGQYSLEIKTLNFTFNRDLPFNYTVKNFGEPLKWVNFTDEFQGYVNTNATGIIKVNFTGEYNKDIHDESIFDNPIPWLNISFIENTTGVLNINNTIYNVSNSETALNLHIGFNNFSSGFLIPTDNLTKIKEKAILEGSGGDAGGFLRIEETGLTIKFIFIKTGGVNFSATTYDKYTGLLMWVKSTSGNFSLEMELVLSYQESDPIPPPDPYTKTIYITDVTEKKGDTEYDNFTLPFVLLVCGAAASFSMLVWKRDIKMLKNIFIGILGAICFSSLLVYNYWLSTGVASIDEDSDETPLEVVEDITLIVDFGDGTVKIWKDFTLTEGKTSVLDALDKYCDIKYEDYGWGILVTEIDGVEGDWVYEVNGEQPGHGADRHYLRDGDEIEWSLV